MRTVSRTVYHSAGSVSHRQDIMADTGEEAVPGARLPVTSAWRDTFHREGPLEHCLPAEGGKGKGTPRACKALGLVVDGLELALADLEHERPVGTLLWAALGRGRGVALRAGPPPPVSALSGRHHDVRL